MATFIDDIHNTCQKHLKCQDCNWYDKDNTNCLFSGPPALWSAEIINNRLRAYDEILKALNIL